MAFTTEFKFTLPRGFVDAEGKVHKDGTMRLATARDEIVPLQDYRVQANRAYLVIVLLSRVITRIGDMTDISVSTVENLFSTDLAYLQEFYRKVNEEGSARVHTACPSCKTEFDLDMVSGQVVQSAATAAAGGGEGQQGLG